VRRCLLRRDLQDAGVVLEGVRLLAVFSVGSSARRLGDIGLYYGHHPTIHFDDHHCAAARLWGPDVGPVGPVEYLLSVSLGNAPNGALAQDNTVVFNQFVHDLSEGLIGAKVGDCAL
jgi:hypothetical protein